MEIQLLEPISVVQGGAADAGARERHRFKFRHGSHHPGAAHLGYQAQEPAGGFFGGVFQGDGPARRLLREARELLTLERIELHHHSIGGVGQLMALLLPAVIEGHHAIGSAGAFAVGIDAEARSFQPLQSIPLALGPHCIGWQVHRVSEEVQPSGGHHLGVELPQGARAGIARIGKEGFPALLALGVDGLKSVVGDEGLAAHFHPGRWLLELQSQRHRLDGAHVGGDLLTAAAISAGGGAHQHPIGVAQGQGIAIDLELADVLALALRVVLQLAPQASIPGLQLFGVEGVIKAEHADAVLNAAEPLSWRAAHPLGGTVSA